ncbi:conserved hypothetical protein [Gluconacetobacter diazotrophicus PA1 5]|uniref:Putative exported protein n=1 Tax=Gluconacetobacter diazotrophicus (strain ATCC 49037 / DSM 5601 / CCUG 37298 / CIP 103539 / LMG 7603 / PAl5) TaxID=272568 RepID=A9HNF9_GLUDA|nr:hypothetical protein [Gluconacetobacter diazotrophicus]ACI50529.1 conserved hypothetical protein [Gluconacetobacter diazotrophicus PA1 5]TWB09361.1 hypothetical protein FBZ86_10423 [Gluconacetobacter diazotrophicus]CAP56438.1 putative exported protein [Gluconacetobacter diazotrophicus PA1 5]
MMRHPTKRHLAWAACVLALLAASPRPAVAQDDPIAGFLPEANGPATVVWCSVQADQRLFISDLIRVASTSRVALGVYGGRFGRTVNARYGLHLGLEINYCHRFKTRAAAATARAAMIGRTAAQNVGIVDVGVY